MYRQYCKPVYSLCLRMTRNEADAQDLTQEAFLQLFRKLDTFRGESAFSTWFYRLVVNLVLMQMRRKWKLLETSLSQLHRARLRLRRLLTQSLQRRAWAGALPAGKVLRARRPMPADFLVPA